MGIRKEGVGKFLLSFGLLIMLHAAYSTAEWPLMISSRLPVSLGDLAAVADKRPEI